MKIELFNKEKVVDKWYRKYPLVERYRWYRLLEDYTFSCGTTVEKGFEWNGASSPGFCSLIIPKAYGTLVASCIHDYLCGLARDKEERKEADVIFRDELVVQGTSKMRSWWGYCGVRVGSYFGVGNAF